jgi:predicted nucleic acid-binding protein
LIVIDASAALELLLQTPKGVAVGDLALATEERLHAPHLIDVEVAQTLRRLTLGKNLTASRAEEALADFGLLALERHEHYSLMSRAWELREGLTAYDAIYVALAEALDAPLLTCDAKLSRAHGHSARITLI